MAGALDMRAEIAHQMHEVTKDPAANQILNSILKDSILYHRNCASLIDILKMSGLEPLASR